MMSKDTGKTYHTKAIGLALETVNKHSSLESLTLFASCFCPFVQRAWVLLEHLGIPYHENSFSTDIFDICFIAFIDEVDPYKKPSDLLEVSPKGLVPALKLNDFDPPRALHESTVIMEYLEDLASMQNTLPTLLPPTTTPYIRALVRLQADHINRNIIPSFYKYLQSQDADAKIENGKKFLKNIERLCETFEKDEGVDTRAVGLWREGGELGWADVMAAPWLFRATNVLPYYRGFAPPGGPKYNSYLARLLNHPSFKQTCSTTELYIDSYERYAYNRPNTSQVANAINSGEGLP